MSKVILELDYMPVNCIDCNLSTYKKYEEDVYSCLQNQGKKNGWYCTAFNNRILCEQNKRRDDCPLREID
jgi:hypothetical protein